MAGHLSITTSNPAASARAAAASSITSSCSHTAFAPIEIASSITEPTSVELTKQSTTSMLWGICESVT